MYVPWSQSSRKLTFDPFWDIISKTFFFLYYVVVVYTFKPEVVNGAIKLALGSLYLLTLGERTDLCVKRSPNNF